MQYTFNAFTFKHRDYRTIHEHEQTKKIKRKQKTEMNIYKEDRERESAKGKTYKRTS